MSDELKKCYLCGGDVMELIDGEEDSMIKCSNCSSVWHIAELWDASTLGDYYFLQSRLKIAEDALREIKDKMDHRNDYRFDQLTTDSFIYHIINKVLTEPAEKEE